MSEAHEKTTGGAGQSRLEPLLRADLESLGQTSRDRLPEISATAAVLRARSLKTAKEGFLMRSWRGILARPVRFSALAGAALVAILIAVPVSYQRTVGFDASLRLAAPDAGSLPTLAAQWKALLRADAVEVHRESGMGSAVTLVARLPRQSLRTLESRCVGFAHGLAERGFAASATVSPRVEQILGNVYALAAERLQEIRINGQGKSPSQIEQEIRARLAAVGAVNPQVSVTRTGNDTRITIQAGAPGGSGPLEQRVTLTDGGAAPSQRFELHRTPGMTDAQLKAEVERQLKARGKEAEVDVTNGRITIRDKTTR